MPTFKTASGLSPKEEQFVAEYLIDGNGQRSAVAAGYAVASARDSAWKMLRKPHIAAALTKARKEQERRTLITADGVLKRLDRIAMKAEANGDFNAANRANQLIGQHYKLFTEKHEHGGIGGGPVVLQVTQADEDL